MILLGLGQGITQEEKMQEILIIEDDELLNDGLCFNLQKAGLRPTPAYNLKQAKEYMDRQDWSLFLLDVNLPDGNGFRFAEEIRRKSPAPIVFLTAQDMDEDMMRGFEAGADDYITKPFNVKIVIQRIQAILRRCEKTEKKTCCRFGNVEVDFPSMSAKKDGKPLALTPTEFRLLKVFLDNPGQVLTREVLLEKLWDQDGNFVDEHTLTINISRLRGKIEDENVSYIKTVYGMGYQWMGQKGADR